MSVKLVLSEPFLRTKEAAHYIGVSTRTLEKHRIHGTGPRYNKAGRRIVYAVADLREWVARRRGVTAGSAIAIIPPAKTPGAGIEPVAGAQRTLLATPAAAHLLRLSPRTLEKHRVQSTGPAYSRISGRVFYELADLMTFTEEGATGRDRPAGRGTTPARKRAARSDGGSR